MHAFYYLLFLVLSKFCLCADFAPAYLLDPERILQARHLAEHIYTVFEELPIEIVADYPSKVRGKDYVVRPFFGETGTREVVRSCMGAIYSDPADASKIYVVHRGSVGIPFLSPDWQTNLNYTPISIAGIGGNVHGGFGQCSMSFYPALSAELQAIFTAVPDVEVFFIGHSLGSALALLSAASTAHDDLVVPRLRPNQIKVLSFSSPRVGCSDFAGNLEKILGKQNVLNIHCSRDVVCGLPLESQGFSDFGISISYSGMEFGGILSPISVASPLTGHLIKGKEEAVEKAYTHFARDLKDPSVPLSEVGKASFWSIERNPLAASFARFFV